MKEVWPSVWPMWVWVFIRVPVFLLPAFEQITDIHEGSVVFNFAELTPTKIMIEGTDEPRWIVNRKGDVSSIEFAIPSPTVNDHDYVLRRN